MHEKRDGEEKLGNSAKTTGPVQLSDVSVLAKTAKIREVLEIALKYHKVGDLEQADEAYCLILRVDPHHPSALRLHGVVEHQRGRTESAIEYFRKAIVIKSDYLDAHYNLGAALKDIGCLEEAISSYNQALSINPNLSEIHSNLGIALKELGNFEEAADSYHKAIEIKPENADAHNNLGNLLVLQEKRIEAIESYRKALAVRPGYVDAYINLGTVLQSLQQLDEAIACYQDLLKNEPTYAEAHNFLGTVYLTRGNTDQAIECYKKASEIRPKNFKYALDYQLALPVILEKETDIIDWRERYRSGLEGLNNGFSKVTSPIEGLNSHFFHLAYHAKDNRLINERRGQVFRRLFEGLNATAPNVSSWKHSDLETRRIKVGFISNFLSQHTIGKLNAGYIQQLDRCRFEVILIHTPQSRCDDYRRNLDQMADKVISLPFEYENQIEIISQESLDFLFFPDIGMEPTSYFLAFARLAPIQAASWGHPDTTGLKTIDYFISAKHIEPENADQYYTETLIRLNRLPMFYLKPDKNTLLPTRDDFGLPEKETLYCCLQSLFKFHPDFDAILAEIATRDPNGRIVVIEGKHAPLTNAIRARWAKSAPILNDRTLFLSRMSPDKFMALQAISDVLLDPIHFGGGNTFYEALVYGTPVVTWPGQFMRARIVAGAYRQMGIIKPPVAESLKDYASIALALGRDPERCQELRQELMVAADKEIFWDKRASGEFELFICEAVDAATRNERLPANWRPTG